VLLIACLDEIHDAVGWTLSLAQSCEFVPLYLCPPCVYMGVNMDLWIPKRRLMFCLSVKLHKDLFDPCLPLI